MTLTISESKVTEYNKTVTAKYGKIDGHTKKFTRIIKPWQNKKEQNDCWVEPTIQGVPHLQENH